MTSPAAPSLTPEQTTRTIEVLVRALDTACKHKRWKEAGGISALLAALEEEAGHTASAANLRTQAELMFMREQLEPSAPVTLN